MKINILTIPSVSGGASHQIPLYVLHQRYFRRFPSINNYFLLPKRNHEEYLKQGLQVLPIDNTLDVQNPSDVTPKHHLELLKKETDAFQMVKPQIILEDGSFSTPLITEKNNIPRMSIQRTGFFRSLPKALRNKNHMHSMEKGEGTHKVADTSSFIYEGQKPDLSIPANRTDKNFIANYLNAKTKLVPGIPLIEKLPDNIENPGSYFYTGPLNVEDNPSQELLKELNDYFEYNQKKKKVFITTGLIDKGNIAELIEYLLKNGYAVISTFPLTNNENYKDEYFYNRFLPLNHICSKADLIIHQCGSGMYHYPLLNQKPTLTIGTQCYDREDVALRLQELGVSKHIPSPKDDSNYMEIFKGHIEAFEKGNLCDFDRLKSIHDNIYETMLGFDMEKAIEHTLN